jgi:hypothetical protein
LLPPALCHAKDVAIPEVGIELTSAPDITSAPFVHREPDGAEGMVRIGEALIVVYRGDAAVPDGTVATEESSRSSLKTAPNLIYWPQTQGTPAALAGRPAWVSYRAYYSLYQVKYVLVASTVIDAHWYVLQVSAQSPAKKPEDFDTAVTAVQNARFGPTGPAPEVVAELPQGTSPHLPRIKPGRIWSFYPPTAIRAEEEGEVDFEFRIDGHGEARDIKVTHALARDLKASAQNWISGIRFDVPHDWEQRGADQQVFRFEVQYTLHCPGRSSVAYPPRVVGAEVVSVCVHLAVGAHSRPNASSTLPGNPTRLPLPEFTNSMPPATTGPGPSMLPPLAFTPLTVLNSRLVLNSQITLPVLAE